MSEMSSNKDRLDLHKPNDDVSNNNNINNNLNSSDSASKRRRYSHRSQNHDLQQSNNHKKLSFLPKDDSDESSSSDDEVVPISSKWITSESNKPLSSDNVVLTKNRQLPDAVRQIDQRLLAEDASSTSSCSCEDHSSVGEQPGELGEDLDYDEDSMTGSASPAPKRNNIDLTPVSSLTADQTPLSKESNPISSDKQQSRSSSNADHNDASAFRDENGNGVDCGEQNRPKPRIKSFISVQPGTREQATNSEDAQRIYRSKAKKSYSSLLRYFFKDACYFQIKSINHDNVHLSKSMGVWSTPHQNEVRLNQAFQDYRNVILIFSVQQSGAFQGFARMVSESRPTAKPIPWVLPERLSLKALTGAFKVEWLCTTDLAFTETHDIINPYNENKPVKVARDGQQVEPNVGKSLCKLFPAGDKRLLLDALVSMRRQVDERRRSSRKSKPYYPLPGRRTHANPRDVMMHQERMYYGGPAMHYPSASMAGHEPIYLDQMSRSTVAGHGAGLYRGMDYYDQAYNLHNQPYARQDMRPYGHEAQLRGAYMDDYQYDTYNNSAIPRHYPTNQSSSAHIDLPAAYVERDSKSNARYHPYQRMRR